MEVVDADTSRPQIFRERRLQTVSGVVAIDMWVKPARGTRGRDDEVEAVGALDGG